MRARYNSLGEVLHKIAAYIREYRNDIQSGTKAGYYITEGKDFITIDCDASDESLNFYLNEATLDIVFLTYSGPHELERVIGKLSLAADTAHQITVSDGMPSGFNDPHYVHFFKVIDEYVLGHQLRELVRAEVHRLEEQIASYQTLWLDFDPYDN